MWIKARLTSEDPNRCALLKRIEVRFSRPLVEELSGEMAWKKGDGYVPPEEVDPGREVSFSYFIRAQLSSKLAGFQDIRLEGLPQFVLDEVRVGWVSDDTVLVGQGESPAGLRGLFAASERGVFRSTSGDTLAAVDTLETAGTTVRLAVERTVFEERVIPSGAQVFEDTLQIHLPQRVQRTICRRGW